MLSGCYITRLGEEVDMEEAITGACEKYTPAMWLMPDICYNRLCPYNNIYSYQ
jgi:hypothetical protein